MCGVGGGEEVLSPFKRHSAVRADRANPMATVPGKDTLNYSLGVSDVLLEGFAYELQALISEVHAVGTPLPQTKSLLQSWGAVDSLWALVLLG